MAAVGVVVVVVVMAETALAEAQASATHSRKVAVTEALRADSLTVEEEEAAEEGGDTIAVDRPVGAMNVATTADHLAEAEATALAEEEEHAMPSRRGGATVEPLADFPTNKVSKLDSCDFYLNYGFYLVVKIHSSNIIWSKISYYIAWDVI